MLNVRVANINIFTVFFIEIHHITTGKSLECLIQKITSRSQCKLFEHIIFSMIWDHLNMHGIITSEQHSFKTSMSCNMQLVEALHDWASSMNEVCRQIHVIVLDFSKAFDMVLHQRLLQKLHCIHGGIPLLPHISGPRGL